MKRYRRGEFGEELGLGELPEDVQRELERVDYVEPMRRHTSTRRDAISDVRYGHNIEKRPRAPGTVPYSGEVISTFDSRPINSIDFSNTTLETWPLTATSTDATTITSTYTPPGGYIAVLRGYRYEMKPLVPIDSDDLFLDILIDGVSQLGYRSLMHGQVLSDFVPCFLLADAGQDITLQLRAPNGINSVTGDTRKVLVEGYGNLIQVTGAPLALEIANKEIGLPVKQGSTQIGGAALRSLLRSRASIFRRFRFF